MPILNTLRNPWVKHRHAEPPIIDGHEGQPLFRTRFCAAHHRANLMKGGDPSRWKRMAGIVSDLSVRGCDVLGCREFATAQERLQEDVVAELAKMEEAG